MMKKIVQIILFSLIMISTANAQLTDSLPQNLSLNIADRLLMTDGNLKIGGYGGVHYNQSVSRDTRYNGNLDVHRFIMMLGYQFNSRTQFITELEFEHVKEVYVEQAFLQYRLNNYVNFRGGLLLIPMGITNEYHEPTNFNGVERPLIDKYIAPTTWREIGFGVSGVILPLSLKYQAYLVNGFASYNGEGLIGGSGGLRGGRQKGAKSMISHPNFSAKIEYFGVRGLNLGLSAYTGKTQSSMYNGMDKNDNTAIATADSSVAGISMIGLDTRYGTGGLRLSGQLYYTSLSNTYSYNSYTATRGGGELGSSMYGFYIDLGYDILRWSETEMRLFPFVRYSAYDTQLTVPDNIIDNPAFARKAVTTGLSFYITDGTVLKADMQFINDGASDNYSATFNAGFGIMF